MDGTAETYQQELEAWRLMRTGNYEEAARRFEPLAIRGSVTALENLGCMYERGRLGPRDEDKAISYWQRAASAGSISSMYRLARLLKDKGDLSRARTLFIEAASQGHKPSMYIVGKMLMRGQGGEIEARSGREWLVRAAEGGHAFAQRDLLWMQIESCGSMRDRIGLYYKLVVLGCSLIPRFARDPYSQDLY